MDLLDLVVPVRYSATALSCTYMYGTVHEARVFGSLVLAGATCLLLQGSIEKKSIRIRELAQQQQSASFCFACARKPERSATRD